MASAEQTLGCTMKFFAGVLALLFSLKASAVEYTKGMVFETNDGVQVGFTLGSPSFKPDTGECVFMLLPASIDVIETPLGILVSELKVAGEHSWRKTDNEIVVHSGGRTLLRIDRDGTVHDASGKGIGMAKPLPEKR